MSGRPELLYNIATAAERTRDDAMALESYAAFLEAVPDTPLRERVETRISQIRAQQAREEAVRAEAARAEAARAEAERAEAARGEGARAESAEQPPRRAVPFALVGGGAAITVAGAVLLGIGASDRAKVESPAPGSRDWDADGARAYDRGPRLATAGWVAAPLGVAALAVGTILVIKTGRANGGDASEEGGVALGLGLGTLTLRGSF
ncbi:MAG: hypothetical protein H5U40_11740 [Polyangiaceae bacterium]|nr:hypothetical protein [Polyangiaceae bacterium]